MSTIINASDQTITQYNVQTGGISNLLNNVAPGATSGVPLISQGSTTQPAFGTALVAGGGTGDTSFTAYSIICGGTSTTGALQNVVGVGSSGQVLTSNGASALPTWQAASSNTSTITSSLTSAQIKTIHGTPVTLIAAPGSGKIIILLSITTKYVYGGNNAFTAGSSQTVNLYYGTATNINVMTANGQLTGTSSIYNLVNQTGELGATSPANIENLAINAYNPQSTEIGGNAAGDNTILYYITYMTITV